MPRLMDITFALEWESAIPTGTTRHRDRLFAGGLDPLRDALPGEALTWLANAEPGEVVTLAVSVADLIGENAGAVFDLSIDALVHPQAVGGARQLRYGLFYPSTLFDLPPNHQARRTIPVRYLGTEKDMMSLDTRHPLTDHGLTLSATVLRVFDGVSDDRPAIDWGRRLAAGPGMQACWRGTATDFVYAGAYARPDEAADGVFYGTPRITAHIDEQAQRVVADFYAGIIPPAGRVLDLMSSAHSNLHPEQRFGALVGLGMNAEEMSANNRLSEAVIADLNAGAPLPFDNSSFDAAICTVSIDYLTDPVRVLREAGRVLRPGAPLAVTYSNRWFPPKVTRLWTELNPFEQMGLVAQYFANAECFEALETVSFRGLPRPADDPYAGQAHESDPVFGVTGRVKA